MNVYDTSGCPRAPRCEVCGRKTTDLRVVALESQVGVSCLTVCGGCYQPGKKLDAPMSILGAYGVVWQHCQHLGIGLDDMAAAVAAVERGEWQ